MIPVLDLCCKAGGSSMGMHQAGFTMTGVDRESQKHYPFTFIQSDLRDIKASWIRKNFAAVIAGPPCQAHTDLAARTGLEYEDFIPETRALVQDAGVPYIIENVEGAPLINPITLCGTQFAKLRVLRHRLFESNIQLRAPDKHPEHPLVFTMDKRKNHYGLLNPYTDYVQVTGGGNCPVDAASSAMNIYWMTKKELNQAIPPDYFRFLGLQLKAAL